MGEIRTIQDRIASLIEGHPYFAAANVEVVRQYRGEILTMITEKLTSLGFGVIVVLGSGDRKGGEYIPYYEETSFTVTATETPSANDTGLRACEAVEEIIKALDRAEVVAGNQNRLFYVTGHAPVTSAKASIDAHQVFVKCEALHQF